MLRNDAEWRGALEMLQAFRTQEQQVRTAMMKAGETGERVELAVCGYRNKGDDLEYEVRLYERLRSGDLKALPKFSVNERGTALICLRILRGWTQRELAGALRVSEAAVSRDENNEYRGLSLAKYARVLDALGFVEDARFTRV